MNDKQNANLNMFQTVSDVLETGKSKYETIAVINSAVAELKEKIAQIRETDKNRSETKVQAATAEKLNAEETMIDAALPVARITNVYAFDTDNPTLAMQTSATKSQFYNRHGNEKISLARTIFEKATENVEALKDYGLSQDMLTALNAAINDFENNVVKPRDTIGERKGHTKNLSQLFAETKSLLYDRLDKLMALFKASDAQFYQAYFSARNVINTAYRKQENKTCAEK